MLTMQDKDLSRQRLPWCFTSPRRLPRKRRNPLDVAIGGFFVLTHGSVRERFVVMRQKTTAEVPCEGCFFFDRSTNNRRCPDFCCERSQRADGCNVIFAKIIP